MIVTQLGGSLLFLTRRILLARAPASWPGFTIVATLLAHPFWSFEGPDRGRQTATFFEHVAIVGGLAMAALFVNGRSGQPDDGSPRTPRPKARRLPPPGTFAPLRHRLFAVIWAATVLGNTGTFMRDVASAWLVTDLSASPAAVAMIQAAGTLPVFLLAIPAGVLSDILDRRRFLIGIQIGLGIVSTALAFLAWTGTVSVASLVALTFLGGVGAALAAPGLAVHRAGTRSPPGYQGSRGAQLARHQHRPVHRPGARRLPARRPGSRRRLWDRRSQLCRR